MGEGSWPGKSAQPKVVRWRLGLPVEQAMIGQSRTDLVIPILQMRKQACYEAKHPDQIPQSFGYFSPPKQKDLFTHSLSNNLLCPYRPSTSQRVTGGIWAITVYCVLGLCTASHSHQSLPPTSGLLEEEVKALRGAMSYPASTAPGQG